MSKKITVNGMDYVLTFEDDFDGGRLDTSKWSLAPEQLRQDIGGRWCDAMTDAMMTM